MFWALKWGILHSSSSNWSRDMTKHKNAMISKFPDFERKIRQILQNSKNWRNNIFMFIDVSPKIFKLQRRTIPHFKGWNKLFWPFDIHFNTKTDISWSAEQNTCPIFFAPDFKYSHSREKPIIQSTVLKIDVHQWLLF